MIITIIVIAAAVINIIHILILILSLLTMILNLFYVIRNQLSYYCSVDNDMFDVLPFFIITFLSSSSSVVVAPSSRSGSRNIYSDKKH